MKALVAWSSGKDSAWCLHVLRQNFPLPGHPGHPPKVGRAGREREGPLAGKLCKGSVRGVIEGVDVAGLLTTVNEAHARVAMHAVRLELLEAQAQAVGLPLWTVPLPDPCSNEQYEARMAQAIVRARESGVTAVAFGDLFLGNVRRYREKMMEGTGLTPLFPLWRLPTDLLARDMIEHGVRARITCVDPRALPAHFIGREFDRSFLEDLPPGVDPCGERGEFHTFAYDGPMFHNPVLFQPGETVHRDGFVFMDLRLAISNP